jgi:hypothetical protein
VDDRERIGDAQCAQGNTKSLKASHQPKCASPDGEGSHRYVHPALGKPVRSPYQPALGRIFACCKQRQVP